MILLTIGLNLSAQNVNLDSNLSFESTDIKIVENDSEYHAYSSYDNNKTDSLTVSVGNVGVGGVIIRINLIDEPTIELYRWSDYNQFDGKNTIKVDLDYYELDLNSTEFESGERIMGRMTGKSKPIKNSLGTYQIEFDGFFSHILGKLMKKKRADENYRIIDN